MIHLNGMGALLLNSEVLRFVLLTSERWLVLHGLLWDQDQVFVVLCLHLSTLSCIQQSTGSEVYFKKHQGGQWDCSPPLNSTCKNVFEDNIVFTEGDYIQCLIFCISQIILCPLMIFQCLLLLVRHVITYLTVPLSTSVHLWKVQMVPGKEAGEKTNSCTSLHSHLCFFKS